MREKNIKNGKEISTHPPTIIFAGYALLPSKATNGGIHGALSVEIEIDPFDKRIVDAKCNLLPALGEKLLTEILIGSFIEDGLERAIAEIRSRYFSVTQRATISTLEEILKRYKEYMNKENNINLCCG